MNVRGLVLVFVVVATLGCASVDRQKAQPAVADDLHFHNLQVLPQNITRDQLFATMRAYNSALGVNCAFCHVTRREPTGPRDLEAFDFPNDAKDHKQVTRTMIRMTNAINDQYIAKLGRGESMPEEFRVNCWTCHRGEAEPAIRPAPAPTAAE